MTRISVENPRTVREALAFVYALMVVALALGHQAMGWAAQYASPRAAAFLPPAFLGAALAVWLAHGARAEA
jgi:cation transporter-like permease